MLWCRLRPHLYLSCGYGRSSDSDGSAPSEVQRAGECSVVYKMLVTGQWPLTEGESSLRKTKISSLTRRAAWKSEALNTNSLHREFSGPGGMMKIWQLCWRVAKHARGPETPRLLGMFGYYHSTWKRVQGTGWHVIGRCVSSPKSLSWLFQVCKSLSIFFPVPKV